MNFFHKLIDSKDSTVEAHLVLLCLGAVTFIALSVYHTVFLQHVFDPASYGSGLGTLLAGGGAAAFGQGMQRKMEGGSDNDSTQ
jgi:hypothetical protein